MARAHDRTLLAQLGFADPDRKSALHDMACHYVAAPENAERLVSLVHGSPATAPNLSHETVSIQEAHITRGKGLTVGFLDVGIARIKVVTEVYEANRPILMPEWRSVLDRAREQNPAFASMLEYAVVLHIAPDHIKLGYAAAESLLASYLKKSKPEASRLLTQAARNHFQRDTTVTFETTDKRVDTERVATRQDTFRLGDKAIGVEVKVHRATAGDVLRQMNLYADTWEWWAAKWIPDGVLFGEGEPPSNDPRCAMVLATCYPIPTRERDALKAAGVTHVLLSPEKIQAWAAARDREAYAAPEL